MNIQQINSSIMFGSLTNDELDSIIDAVKWARAGLVRQNKQRLRVGTTVRWTSDKNPRGEPGTVLKIATKYVTVKLGSGAMWRVPANRLEIV